MQKMLTLGLERCIAPMCIYRKGPAQPTRQVCQYGIRVSFWGSGTLKIVIYVENYPQKRCFRLADYHPPLWWGVLISGQYIYVLTIYVHVGG